MNVNFGLALSRKNFSKAHRRSHRRERLSKMNRIFLRSRSVLGLTNDRSGSFCMRTVHRQDNLGHNEVAISLLHLASSGNVREAYEKYIGPTFHHHNPHFKGDVVSLMNGVKENAAKFPGEIFEVQRALEVGDLVAVHCHVQIKPDDRGLGLVHIFRFRNDRITGSRRSLLRSALARN